MPKTLDPNAIVQSTPVTTTVHKPGDPLETAGDRAANVARRAEPVAAPYCFEASTPDSRSPAANLASRPNIVADGPGTAGE